jgi:hypothetical protein
MGRKALIYAAVLIGGYLMFTHATGAARVTNAGGRNSVNLIRALQGRSR